MNQSCDDWRVLTALLSMTWKLTDKSVTFDRYHRHLCQSNRWAALLREDSGKEMKRDCTRGRDRMIKFEFKKIWEVRKDLFLFFLSTLSLDNENRRASPCLRGDMWESEARLHKQTLQFKATLALKSSEVIGMLPFKKLCPLWEHKTYGS